MKKYAYILFAFCTLSISTGFSQGKSKQEKRIQIKEEIEQLVNSQNFEFIAKTAFPVGSSPVDINSNNYSVSFTPNLIISFMPFYGTGYSGMAFGPDTGMKFQGKPEQFQVENKPKGFEINALVTSKNDSKTLSLSISDSGSAILNISSNDRSTISYQGEIRAIKK